MALELLLPVGYYQANMLFQGSGAPRGAAMTFGGSAGAASAAALAASINTAWNTHLKSIFASTVTLAGTRVKLGPMSNGPFAYVASGTAGTDISGASSPQCALLIRKNTAMGGRQGTGRMYMPGLAESAVDVGGNIDGTKRTQFQTAFTAFLGGLNSVSAPMYLLHNHGTYILHTDGGDVVRTLEPVQPTEVTSLSVDSVAATQRRRLRG